MRDGVKDGFGLARLQESGLQTYKAHTEGEEQNRLVRVRVR